MGDMVHVPSSGGESQMQNGRLTKSYVVCPTLLASKRAMDHLICPKPEDGLFSQVLSFVLKVGVLEIARRFSRNRAPFIWHAIQSLQFLIYPPFKWIQRWRPLKKFADGIQIFSRPLMFLSVVTAFSDHCQSSKKISNSKDSSTPPDSLDTSEERIVNEVSQRGSDKLHAQLKEELQEDGVIFPDRMNVMEIENFHAAANGDYASLKQSVRKTIRWRESFSFLSSQELKMWSHFVFWHGRDVDLQPCLIVRLGLAFCSLEPHERPCFIQAVVSQLEHGVLHLTRNDDPRITALVDCDGLAAVRFPMQMIRSCATLLQDHYPNRLSALLVTRLPPPTLATAEKIIQNLKSVTQKKVHIWEEIDPESLNRFLQSVPSFLGGSCTCVKCQELLPSSGASSGEGEVSVKKLIRSISDSEVDRSFDTDNTSVSSINCEQVLRTTVICMLLLWVFLVLFIGMRDTADGFLTS